MSRLMAIVTALCAAGLLILWPAPTTLSYTVAEEVGELLPTFPARPSPPPKPTIGPAPTIPICTPTPSPVQLPLVVRQLRDLDNGGFETGRFQPHWVETGELSTQIVGGGLPRTGLYAALLGDPRYNSAGECPVGVARLSQVLDVPREGHPTLHVWYRIWSNDTIDYDFFAIDIAAPDGQSRERLHRDGCTLWTGSLWSSGWREAIVSLDNYRGSTIYVELVNAMTNADGWYNTWTYVDDITLSNMR